MTALTSLSSSDCTLFSATTRRMTNLPPRVWFEIFSYICPMQLALLSSHTSSFTNISEKNYIIALASFITITQSKACVLLDDHSVAIWNHASQSTVIRTCLSKKNIRLRNFRIVKTDNHGEFNVIHYEYHSAVGYHYAHEVITTSSSVLVFNPRIFNHKVQFFYIDSGKLYINNRFEFQIFNLATGACKNLPIYPTEVVAESPYFPIVFLPTIPLETPLRRFVVHRGEIWFSRERMLWCINVNSRDYKSLAHDDWDDAQSIFVNNGLIVSVHQRQETDQLDLLFTQPNLKKIIHVELFIQSLTPRQLKERIDSVLPKPLPKSCVIL